MTSAFTSVAASGATAAKRKKKGPKLLSKLRKDGLFALVY